VGKKRARLLLAAGLVVGAWSGRYALNASAASVGFAGRAVLTEAANNVSCFDTSPHKANFVTVAPDVRLEVLDWGGSGETMVLLTGSGDNAHAYDEFAYQFTDRFHVIGVTRRGYGRSSQPPNGYDLDTRARDDIAVLDKLNISRAVFVGHSLAGTELSKLGAAYPNRVTKLVYLDALDIGGGGWAALPQPPRAPELTPAAMCNMIRTDSAGRITGSVTPPEIGAKILAGLQPADYPRIQAPALGIFNAISPQFRMAYYWSLGPAKQDEFTRSIAALSTWANGAIQRFRSSVKNSRVVELHDSNHYVYVVDEALVVREMRKFLLEK